MTTAAMLAVLLCAACSFPQYGFSPAAAGSAGTTGGAQGGGAGGTTAGAPDAEGGLAGAAAEGGADGGSAGQPTTIAPHCLALLEADPSLPSAAYAIDPDGGGPSAPFEAYCDMELDGGGWTLLANLIDASFNATANGSTSQHCYDTTCANRAYATLPLQTDVRLDSANSAIAGAVVDSTAIFHGIHETSTGRTLRSIFLSGEPAYLKAPASTVGLQWYNGTDCSTWPNYGAGLCEDGVLVVFAIPSGCDATIFALGVTISYDGTSAFCAGWPQQPDNDFPSAFRFWTR